MTAFGSCITTITRSSRCHQTAMDIFIICPWNFEISCRWVLQCDCSAPSSMRLSSFEERFRVTGHPDAWERESSGRVRMSSMGRCRRLALASRDDALKKKMYLRILQSHLREMTRMPGYGSWITTITRLCRYHQTPMQVYMCPSILD